MPLFRGKKLFLKTLTGHLKLRRQLNQKTKIFCGLCGTKMQFGILEALLFKIKINMEESWEKN